MTRPGGVLLAAVLALAVGGCTATASAPPSALVSGSSTAASSTPRRSAAGTPRPPANAPDRPVVALPTTHPPGFVAALQGAGLEPYRKQTLTWRPCSDGRDQCASVTAPLDYDNPQQQGITLRLRRVPASQGPRLGTLFVNPGGPGYGGQNLVRGFNRTGLERYDVVGWDPRGTGESTPVVCDQGPDGALVDTVLAVDGSPDTTAETATLIKAAEQFGKLCVEKSGTLLAHISTIDTVHDLDLLRELVGDASLHFFGYSYGTQIGAYYAELYPTQVGRMVLDSAVDIVDDPSIIQAMGFDLALQHFAQWCTDAANDCRLGPADKVKAGTVTARDIVAHVTKLFDALDARPLPLRDRRKLTQSLAVTGVVACLYSQGSWEYLAAALRDAERGDGRRLLAAADQQNGRSASGRYDTSQFAFPAIACLDNADRGISDALAEWKDDERKAPVFGRYFGPNVTCALWPVKPVRELRPVGRGAAPILVIGTTGDSATPYQQAVTMASTLDSGVLLTLDGEGHGAYGGDSTCINAAVVRYLVIGQSPADGTRCR